MRIAEINMVHVGSTGRIMLGVAEVARNSGNCVHTFSPRYYQGFKKGIFVERPHHTYVGGQLENYLHLRLAQLTGLIGCFSYIGTCRLLKKLELFKPDVVHLHNLHNCSINIPLLFRYFKKKRIKVIWTLHDCWPFTGQCSYFDIVQCDRWKTECHHCSQIGRYPKSCVDNTRMMYRMKKQIFNGLDSLTLVTPSMWLAGLVRESFLKRYPIKVINNGIDLTVFSPRKSDFREKYNIPDNKYIVLGVAFGWGYGKGLDVFLRLAASLNDDYQIVLVGTDKNVDVNLPHNILSIPRTNNCEELIEGYSAADVFVNPTREDNFPTVNIESLACGTPVITFRAGGSPEIIDETCGSAVECNDVEALEREIIRICNDKPYSQEACVKRAQQFDQREKFKEYVKLYEDCAYRA